MRASLVIGFVSLTFGLFSCQTRQPDHDVAALDSFSDRHIASGPHVDTSGYLYDAADTSCGGFPRLKVETMPGTCLGLVLAKERAVDFKAKRAFSMPRTLVQIPGTKDFLVADMGSWHPGRGALYRMSFVDGSYQLTLLRAKMDFPHAVKLGPDGKFWVGEMKTISRFTLSKAGQISNWEVVVANLPASADDSHLLSQFTFDPRTNDLYVNSGAPSDHCFVKDPNAKVCPEIQGNDRASLLKIPWAAASAPPSGGVTTWKAVARGLRNSIAMTISPTGTFVQGENGRDFSDSEEPFEEMNIINIDQPQVFNFGWPYCYDFHATSPEWEANSVVSCAQSGPPSVDGDYQAPYILMPPHAAPLGAGYYHGQMFPALEGKLLMAWHGYRPTGHRLVAYSVDSTGRPLLDGPQVNPTYSYDHNEDACVEKRTLSPRGGRDRSASYSEIISKWNARKGLRPLGAPASFTVAEDGSIWIAEDKNQTIVRLAADAKSTKEICDPNTDDRMPLLAWRRAVIESPQLEANLAELQTKLVSKYCASCHDGGVDKSVADDKFSGLDFLTKNQWFIPQNQAKSKALQAILHAGTTPAMPLAGSPQFIGTVDGDEITKLAEDWVSHLPTDVESRVSKTTLKASRKIRATPSANGTLCGQLASGDTVYIDPRSSTFTKADGWQWARVYLTPDHKALVGSKCAWPIDGVFYMATQKK